MIPDFVGSEGYLPPGEHLATWDEVTERFSETEKRRELIKGLKAALDNLRAAGCKTAYIDGSFVTRKRNPNDFDACW